MTKRLIVYLGQTWPEQPATHWVLLDEAGNVLQKGYGSPAAWPAADLTEAVIGEGQCLWLTVPVPAEAKRVKRADQDKLIRNALEEKIIDDVDDQHVVLTHRHASENGIQAHVLVIAKKRIAQLRDTLVALEKPAQGFYAELQTCPVNEGECSLALRGGDWILRSGDAALPLPEAVLEQALDLHAGDGAPLHLYLPAESHDALPSSLSAYLMRRSIHAKRNPYAWWAGIALADNLLQGEFAPARKLPSLRPQRPALVALALLLLLQVVLVLGGWAKDRWTLAQTRSEMAQIFQRAVPGQPLVLPATQLHQRLDEERWRHGLLRERDALALLATFTEAMGPDARNALQQVDYNGQHLEITLTPEAGNRIAAPLAERLAIRGLRAEAMDRLRWRISPLALEE